MLFGGTLSSASLPLTSEKGLTKRPEVTGVVAELEAARKKLKAELHRAKKEKRINEATAGQAFRTAYQEELVRGSLPLPLPLRDNYLRRSGSERDVRGGGVGGGGRGGPEKRQRRKEPPRPRRQTSPLGEGLAEKVDGPERPIRDNRRRQRARVPRAPLLGHTAADANKAATLPLSMAGSGGNGLGMTTVGPLAASATFHNWEHSLPGSATAVAAPALPIFRLPQVGGGGSSNASTGALQHQGSMSSSSMPLRFRNRLPADETPEERAAREQERAEVQRMQQLLGIGPADLEKLEADLGLRLPEEETNEVEAFLLSQQLDSGPSTTLLPELPSPALSSAASSPAPWAHRDGRGGKRRRHQGRLANGRLSSTRTLSTTLLDRPPTPDLLKTSSTHRPLEGGYGATAGNPGAAAASAAALRAQLALSVQSVRGYTEAVKGDVLAAQRLAPVRGRRGRRFLKRWATERLFAVCDDLAFSLAAIAFRRWAGAASRLRRRENLHGFLRYQGAARLLRALDAWRLRRAAAAWLRWVDAAVAEKRAEQEARERAAVLLVQRAYRGHRARGEAARLRAVVRSERRRAAATRLQALARGRRARGRVLQLRQEMLERGAAETLQRALKGALLRRQGRRRLRAMREERAVVRVQCAVRRRRARRRVAARREDRRRQRAARVLQRAARGRQGRKMAAAHAALLRRHRAATALQKHARRKLARRRVARLRADRARRAKLRHRAAIEIQRVYRGHRGRIRMQLELAQVRAARRRRHEAATVLQKHGRRMLAKRVVAERRKEWRRQLLADARAWKETWSEDAQAWFYHNTATGEALWEPPSGGYTKDDGRLVLLTGEVIEDPDDEAAQEAKEQRRREQLCVECEEKAATRHCEECGDRFCTACFNAAHESGQRAKHTWVRLGVIECAECEERPAAKWCTACDDPFCEECWAEVHAKGRRQAHEGAPIGEDGGVVGADGEVLSAGARGGGGGGGEDSYAADYAVESYGEDTVAAEGYGSADEGAGGEEWAQHAAEDGTPFWYNAVSGESVWEDPYAEAEAGAAAAGQEEAGGDWAEYADDDGNPYWYSASTGESTYDNPFAGGDAALFGATALMAAGGGGGGGAAAEEEGEGGGVLVAAAAGGEAGGAWAEYYDDDGNAYYYNAETGESTYERPAELG